MDDKYLLWFLEILLLIASVLQILLARKKGQPLSPIWMVQAFVFPAFLLAGLVLFYRGTDVIFPLVLLGLAEELICWLIRKSNKSKKNENDKTDAL